MRFNPETCFQEVFETKSYPFSVTVLKWLYKDFLGQTHTSCVGSSLVWNFERKLLETRWSQKSKQDKFHRIIQFDKKMDDNIHPLTTMFLISSQTGWIKTQSWQKTVEMKRKGASLQHWRVAKFVLGRLLETRSQGALHSPTFGGHQSTVARAEVNISPKYFISSRNPKWHETPGTPCYYWLVIFLHGPQREAFLCTIE